MMTALISYSVSKIMAPGAFQSVGIHTSIYFTALKHSSSQQVIKDLWRNPARVNPIGIPVNKTRHHLHVWNTKVSAPLNCFHLVVSASVRSEKRNCESACF